MDVPCGDQVQSSATVAVTPDWQRYETDKRSLEAWLSDVETRIEEAEGDEDKMKVSNCSSCCLVVGLVIQQSTVMMLSTPKNYHMDSPSNLNTL